VVGVRTGRRVGQSLMSPKGGAVGAKTTPLNESAQKIGGGVENPLQNYAGDFTKHNKEHSATVCILGKGGLI